MSKAVTARKCSECGKRRIPAKRSNGRLSTKCNECFGGLFWSSAFGRWFAEATTRQSPDSMPIDEEDIKKIYELWLQRKKAIGYKAVDGALVATHDYHISHRDPASGNGFQGRFTAENLIVAPVRANQSAYNAEPVDHGHRIYTDKSSFKTAEKVRQWCRGQYALNEIVKELGLKKYSPPKKDRKDIDPDFLPEGLPPALVLQQQFRRFEGGGTSPWRHTTANPSEMFVTAISYGIGLGSGKLKQSQCKDAEDPDDEF